MSTISNKPENPTGAPSVQPSDSHRRDYRDEALCKQCGYRLRGLPEPRCPECGQPFDPFDPETMNVPELVRAARRKPKSFGEQLADLAFWAFVICSMGRACTAIFVPVGLMLWVYIIIRWARHKPAHGKPTGSFLWRAGVAIFFVVSLLISVHYNSCDHVTAVGIGQVGIGYSTMGGPCHVDPLNGGAHLFGKWYVTFFK